MKSSIHACVEEEFGAFFSALSRRREGWRPRPVYFRGPGATVPGLLSPLVSLLGIWLYSRRPPRLADLDPRLLADASVSEVSGSLGSYGMGGPGFVGLRLASPGAGSRWIVITIWGAEHWLTLEGATALAGFLGSRFVAAQVRQDRARLEFARDGVALGLEVRRDSSHLPPFGGSGEPRAMPETEDLRDAFVVSRKARLWLSD